MTVQVNDIVRATVEGEGVDGQDIQNTFLIRNVNQAVTDAIAITDLITLLEALYSLLEDILSIAYVVRGVKFINHTQQADIGTGLFVDDTPGIDAGAAMPPQICAGITLTTGRLSVRGRKYFGLLVEADIDGGGILTPGAILDLADVGDVMTANQVEAGTTWQFGVEASLDSVWLPFQSYAISTSAVTQRRRRRGVGS